MSSENNPGKSLKQRRGAGGLELTGPMPDVVIERAVAAKHNLRLPSPMPRGIRSHHASPIVGSLSYNAAALGDDTGATLTYGNWAASGQQKQPEQQQQQQQQQGPSPAQDEGGVGWLITDHMEYLVHPGPEEEEGALPPAPTLEPITGPPSPVIPPMALDQEQTTAPTARLAPFQQEDAFFTGAMPQSGSCVVVGQSLPSSSGPGVTMNQPPQPTLLDRWNCAIRLIHDESIKVFIRACFCGGQRLPLNLAISREVVVGDMATRLMSDLRILNSDVRLAMVYFRPPCHLLQQSVSPAQLRQFHIFVKEEDGRQIIAKLLANQSFGQALHAGKAICSHACRAIVEIMRPVVQQELHLRSSAGWEYFGELTEALTCHFIELMIPQMAIHGSHRHDEHTVQLLAHYTNRIAFWHLINRRFAKARTLAEQCLRLIRTAAISPPPDWYPRGFRHTYDFDQNISEYKTVIYRRQRGIAGRILICVRFRQMPGRGFLKGLPDLDVHDFDDIRRDADITPSIWDTQVADPANILG